MYNVHNTRRDKVGRGECDRSIGYCVNGWRGQQEFNWVREGAELASKAEGSSQARVHLRKGKS